jgi:hypothetical protein
MGMLIIIHVEMGTVVKRMGKEGYFGGVGSTKEDYRHKFLG